MKNTREKKKQEVGMPALAGYSPVFNIAYEGTIFFCVDLPAALSNGSISQNINKLLA